jgi:hypothetical protein
MADRPILFSGQMVRALLEGRKFQTRRVLNTATIKEAVLKSAAAPRLAPKRGYPRQDGRLWQFRAGDYNAYSAAFSVPYAVGDRLYVREAWRTATHLDRISPKMLPVDTPVFYEADAGGEAVGATGKFRQGMHMPRWASRITLTITDVHVQRLQEISSSDAKAEGIEYRQMDVFGMDRIEREHFYQGCFSYLWNSINADRGYSWDVNPWVVAVTFTVERRNIDQARP